ncbi:ATP-binding cassette domain-containing protein [uncultured Acetatifactor sp.]|uniref:ABC transporter ATP-binding protein n=1 Tax=uncultured Acetatifactor sp. TaxID=1671927 RepID=UPI002F4295B5
MLTLRMMAMAKYVRMDRCHGHFFVRLSGDRTLREGRQRVWQRVAENGQQRTDNRKRGRDMNIIETRQLSKTYRRVVKQEGIKGSVKSLFKREYEQKQAVKEMDFSVREGEFVGLIGPNGAGKTTLIKMLTGIIAPSSGEIQVMGFYPNDLKNDFKRQYAIVMGQKSQLFFELTVNDTLRMFQEIYGLKEQEFREAKEYFTALFGVEKLLDVQVRTLSLGERMKMELMAALLHNPRILFLDEPTIGLDAVASRQIRRFLREINQERGTTILLTSHYMEDIRALCDRSVVINHGQKIYDGETEELFEKYQRDRQVTLSFDRAVEGMELPERAVLVEETPYKKVVRVPREESGALLQRMMEYGPRDVIVEEDEIGRVVERIYEEGA